MTETPSHKALLHSLLTRLRAAQGADGLWEGRLSSSALATAVAAFALHRLDAARHREPVRRALQWLTQHVNPDGGWGDAPQCQSNLSTTLLCWSALSIVESDSSIASITSGAETWIRRCAGDLSPDAIMAAILDAYGRDRTFSTPILAMCAMAGRLGAGVDAWRAVPQVPFELAALPARFYRRLRLPMVSYALPALIAMGLVRHRHIRSAIPGLNRLRDRLTPGLLDRLTRLQPPGGGFLEAAPLTGFVAMSLCEAGEARHPVATRAGEFLLNTVREDGSWPIDTNLSLWLTTQTIEALSLHPDGVCGILEPERADRVLDRLLEAQGKEQHPYTGAEAGGWAWTTLPGGVPDADDTAGALAALRRLTNPEHPRWTEVCAAAEQGIRWLLGVQNRDGGIPTFCRGWGRLPFDRSCPDLTAHAMGALLDWRDDLLPRTERAADRGLHRMTRFLLRTQQRDGSWIPLWFGNEQAHYAENRLYGTARTVPVLHRLGAGHDAHSVRRSLSAALGWLRENQNEDGGWGAERGTQSTLEETGLALQALSFAGDDPDAIKKGPARASPATERSEVGSQRSVNADFRPLSSDLSSDSSSRRGEASRQSSQRLRIEGLNWLAAHIDAGNDPEPTPIGLYFARLWYGEALYPIIFPVASILAGMRGPANARKSRTR